MVESTGFALENTHSKEESGEPKGGLQNFLEFISSPNYISPETVKTAYEKHSIKADADQNGYLTKLEIDKYTQASCAAGSCDDTLKKETRALSVLAESVGDLQGLSRDEKHISLFDDSSGVTAQDMRSFGELIGNRNEQLKQAFAIQEYIIENRGVIVDTDETLSQKSIERDRRWQPSDEQKKIADLAINHLDTMRSADGNWFRLNQSDVLHYPHYIAHKLFKPVTDIEHKLNFNEKPGFDMFPVASRPWATPVPPPLARKLEPIDEKPPEPPREVAPPEISNKAIADKLNLAEISHKILSNEKPLLDIAKRSPHVFFNSTRYGYRLESTFETDSREVADAKRLVSDTHYNFSYTEKSSFAFSSSTSFINQIDGYSEFIERGPERLGEALQIFDTAAKVNVMDKNSDGMVSREEMNNASAEAKKQFSPRELAILSQKFEELRVGHNTWFGEKRNGISKDSLEEFALQELSDKSVRLYMRKIQNEQGIEFSFAKYFDSYSPRWDFNSNGRIEKSELEESVKKSKGQEHLIASLTLKHFDTLNSLGKPTPLLSRAITRNAIRREGLTKLHDISLGEDRPIFISKNEYKHVISDLLRHNLLP